MDALELVIGCMSNDFLSYMKHEKKITMDENELNAILYKHLCLRRAELIRQSPSEFRYNLNPDEFPKTLLVTQTYKFVL